MKRSCTRLLALLCALLLLLPAMPAAYAAEAEAVNLLKNGGFENGWTNVNWTFDPANATDGDTILNPQSQEFEGSASEGLYFLKIWSANGDSFTAKQSVTLDAGSYKITADILGEKFTPTLFVGTEEAECAVASSSEYNTIEHTFKVESAGTVDVGLKLVCSANAWGRIDNVTLTKVEEESPEIPSTGYAVVVTPSETTVEAGDTVSLSAQVYKDGQELTLGNDTKLWWWTDTWGTHAGANSDADYSNYDNNSGLSLTADVTVKSAGTYYIAAELKNSGNSQLAIAYCTITVTEPEAPVEPVESTLYVPYVTDDKNFIRGADVSSLLSILNSGARFKNWQGVSLGESVEENGQAFMNLLKEAGVNWIRLRVWNNPFNAKNQGYGGGNNDINAAVKMGKWASDAGMKVLIDFHYSDFWADPGKQQAPKEWKDYSIDEKVTAVKEFTTESLNALINAGVDVGMVQVGNETTGAICGEDDWTNMAQIFSAGCDAVHAVAEKHQTTILAAIHFTNPETAGKYTTLAKNLNDNNVDYDVFASSYYPYWHGTIENLTSVLKTVATTYKKKVMVAETSWAWTLKDGDGHANTVAVGSNDVDKNHYGFYPFTVQGQATEFATVAQAVKDVGDAGLGLFYWENAWIPVQNLSNLSGSAYNTALKSNQDKWEQFGSGWAASYSKEYDPEDAGVWYGGSAVDNQAMFDFDGKPLESLNVFKYIQTGTTGYKNEIVSVENPSEEIEIGGKYTIPDKVTVTYTDSTTESLTVTWDEADLGPIDVTTPGTHTVRGTVTKDGKSASVTYTLTVKLKNLLQNPSFENADESMYAHKGSWDRQDKAGDAHSGNYAYHFYSASTITDYTVEQTVTLEPGVYSFSLYAQGGDVGDSSNTYSYVKFGDQNLTQKFTLTGWAVWQNPVIKFTVTEETQVTVGVSITAAAGAWGTVDDWALNMTGEYVPPCTHPEESVVHVAAKAATYDAEGNIEYWHCTDCGKYFKAQDLTEENEITQAQTVIDKLTADQCKHPADVLEHVTAKAATYDAEGNIEYWHCNDCGKYFKAQELTEENEIDQAQTVIDKLTRPSGGGTGGTGGTGGGTTSSVTTSGDETTAAPSANSSGSVTVPESMGRELVDKTASSGSGTAVVAPKFTAGSDSAQVTLPGSALTGLAEKTDADLRVDTPAADVTIPNEALSELGKGGRVTVATEGSDDTVTVTVSVDGKSVDQVTGGLKAALALKDGEVAVLVNDDGTETILPKSLVEDGVTYVVLDGSATVKVIDNSKTFDDVSGSSWFADAVDFASSHALFNGVSSTTFAPDTDMSRAMLATVLWRLESEAEASEPVEFPDVPDGQWYTDAIAWASENGIVLGYDDGSFNTNGSATRQELVVMVYRYAKLAGIDTAGSASLDTFTDGSAIADWAESAMKWAVSNGIIQGYDGKLDPTGTASRAEVATICQRLVGLLVGK